VCDVFVLIDWYHGLQFIMFSLFLVARSSLSCFFISVVLMFGVRISGILLADFAA